MKIIILLLFFSLKSFAIDGVITVLEAPMFKEPNLLSKVVQWVRKGDTIYLHPEILQIIDEHQEVAFYKTLDHSGHTVYISRNHVWVTTDDVREFTQELTRPDPTDYRLQEPLPEKYPLIQPSGYRAQYLFAVSQPSDENYPYNQKIAAKEYSYRYEFSAMFTKRTPNDLTDRWYVGGILTVRSYYNHFVLKDRKTKENWTKIGIGPTLMNDLYRLEKLRINWNTSLLFYPFNNLSVSQEKWSTGETQQRTYQAWSMSVRSGLYYQQVHVLGDIDFIAGIWSEFEPTQKFRYKDGHKKRQWWGSGESDSFRVDPIISLGAAIGLQSSY